MEFSAHAARVLDTAAAKGADYCDVRFERSHSERVEVRNGDVSGLADERSDGYGIRALVKGAWGFASSNGFGDAALDAAAPRAVAIGRAGAEIAARRIGEACRDGRIAIPLVVHERPAWFAAPRYSLAAGGRPYAVCSRQSVERAGIDQLWIPFNGPSWRPRFAGPKVATLQDASTFVLPGFSDDARASFRAAAGECAHILTDSQFSAAELARVLDLSPTRITAIPLGVAPARAADLPALDPATYGRFVLYVGGTEPRKNPDTVLAAMRTLAQH